MESMESIESNVVIMSGVCSYFCVVYSCTTLCGLRLQKLLTFGYLWLALLTFSLYLSSPFLTHPYISAGRINFLKDLFIYTGIIFISYFASFHFTPLFMWPLPLQTQMGTQFHSHKIDVFSKMHNAPKTRFWLLLVNNSLCSIPLSYARS